MKKLSFFAATALLVHAGWFETLQSFTSGSTKSEQVSTSITSDKAQAAMQDALKVGIQEAVKQLGKRDGFYKDPQAKIPLPKNLELVAKTLQKVGMGKYVKQFELSMNRAAEEAVPQTASILYDTLRSINTKKAKELVLSQNEHAITDYFRQHAGNELAQKIAPIIKKHMENEQVTKYYQLMMEYYNKYAPNISNNALANTALGAFGISAPQRIEEKDLSSYVTNKTLDALFFKLAQKEQQIRSNPIARSTKILQEVFGRR